MSKRAKIFIFAGLLIGILTFIQASLATYAYSAVQTRYYRSDTHTVNGLSAKCLGVSNSAAQETIDYVGSWEDNYGYIAYESDIIIRHANGTETVLGSYVARTERSDFGEGDQSATWGCPATVLALTDAIKVVEWVHRSGQGVFITEQLGWCALNAATWTFTRYTCYQGEDIWNEGLGAYQYRDIGYTYYGASGCNTRIEGLSYTPITAPTVSTNPVSNIEETTATGNGNVTNTGGENPTRYIEWGPNTSYGSQYDAGTGGTGSYSGSMTGLSPGTLYYCRAKAHNSAGWGYGSDAAFTTKPDAPSNLSATAISDSRIDLSWSKGSGADKTMVRRKTGSYPTSPSDGTQVYFDTATSCSDTGLSRGTTYYYRAWSYKSGAPDSGYSDSYSPALATTYENIGLRISAGSQIISIACEPAGTLTSPLKIAKGGMIYGIVLVDPSNSMASKMRIQTSSGIKALRKL